MADDDVNWTGGNNPEAGDVIGMASAPLPDVESLLDELRAQQLSPQPRAEIRQIGRWTYRVSVHHGVTVWGPNGCCWHVYGRRRAERKARRVLASYLRMQQRGAQTAAVTVNDLTDRKEQP